MAVRREHGQPQHVAGLVLADRRDELVRVSDCLPVHVCDQVVLGDARLLDGPALERAVQRDARRALGEAFVEPKSLCAKPDELPLENSWLPVSDNEDRPWSCRACSSQKARERVTELLSAWRLLERRSAQGSRLEPNP